MQSLCRRAFLAAAAGLTAAAATAGCGRAEPDGGSDDDLDVLIVGAGVAGLAAARTAARAGRTYAVLEARERVGGRVWTTNAWAGVPVDLGASWIHGSQGNPVYDEAVALGIPTAIFDVGSADGSGSSLIYRRDGARVDEAEVSGPTDAVLAALADGRAGPALSMRDALGSLPRALRAVAGEPLISGELTAIAADYGATPAELALSALDEDDSLPGPQRVFPGGYAQLADRMAEGLRISLNTTVTGISLRDPRRVVVRAGDRRWSAAAVILTVPLGVLKAGSIAVDPPLPPAARRAIDVLGFGRYEKLVLRFEAPFWDDVDQIVVVDRPVFRDWYNLHRVTGEPVLMALNGAEAAVSLDGLSAPRQAAAAADVLKGLYGSRFAAPLAALASVWGADPLSRGSYSFTAAGSGPDDRIALGEPVGDRLWLAGEACHPTLHSTVHGAYASGRAAAEQACR